MAMKLYSDVDIQDIADAIREKSGSAATYKVSEMSAAIRGIPTPKAKQSNLASSSIKTTTYTKTLSMTVEKTGTYKVSWVGIRNSNVGTNGSQLYINNSAYSTARTTFDNQNVYFQQVLLTGVSLTAGQTIEVRARSRSTSYYMTVANFVIEEE